MEKVTDKLFFIEHRDTKAQSFIYENSVHEANHRLYNYFSVSLSLCVQSNYPISLNAGVMNQRLYISVASW